TTSPSGAGCGPSGSVASVGGALHATVVVTGSDEVNTEVHTTMVAAARTAPATAAGTIRRRRNGRPRSSVALPSVIRETTRPCLSCHAVFVALTVEVADVVGGTADPRKCHESLCC